MMSFLHDEKNVVADEFPRVEAPICEWCETEMWMMRLEKNITDDGIDAVYAYECPNCRAKKKIRQRTADPAVVPLTPPVA